MGFPTNKTDSTGTFVLSAKGAAVAPTPVGTARPATSPSSLTARTQVEASDLIKQIDQTESTLREQLNNLRNCIRLAQGSPESSVRSKDLDPNAMEQILQVEREKMAQQRAQEQEQLRATMQHLADAWLRLEQEQLAQSDKSQTSQHNPPPAAGHLVGDAQWWTSNTAITQSSQIASPSIGHPPTLEFQPKSSALVAVDAKNNEELFHKLRVDLMKQAGSKSS